MCVLLLLNKEESKGKTIFFYSTNVGEVLKSFFAGLRMPGDVMHGDGTFGISSL